MWTRIGVPYLALHQIGSFCCQCRQKLSNALGHFYLLSARNFGVQLKNNLSTAFQSQAACKSCQQDTAVLGTLRDALGRFSSTIPAFTPNLLINFALKICQV